MLVGRPVRQVVVRGPVDHVEAGDAEPLNLSKPGINLLHRDISGGENLELNSPRGATAAAVVIRADDEADQGEAGGNGELRHALGTEEVWVDEPFTAQGGHPAELTGSHAPARRARPEPWDRRNRSCTSSGRASTRASTWASSSSAWFRIARVWP